MQPIDSAALWTVPGPEIMECPKHLDSTTAPSIEEDALLCIESGAHELILDARHTTYLTAAGLRTILVLAKALKNVDGRLAICNLGPQAEQMFNQCGFDGLVDNYGFSEEESSEQIA